MHTSSRAPGTRQRGGNAEAGLRQSGLTPAELPGEYRPAWTRGGTEAMPWDWRVGGSPEVGPGQPSAAENVTLAPGCRRSGETTAGGSLASLHMGVPPTAAVQSLICYYLLHGPEDIL